MLVKHGTNEDILDVIDGSELYLKNKNKKDGNKKESNKKEDLLPNKLDQEINGI